MPDPTLRPRKQACNVQPPRQGPAPDKARVGRNVGSGINGRTAQRLCGMATLAAATAFAVPVGALVAPTRRDAAIAFARQSAMYLAHVAFELSYSEVGRAFGRDRTTAAHACQCVEDRRDDPVIDAMLAALESACACLARKPAAPVRS